MAGPSDSSTLPRNLCAPLFGHIVGPRPTALLPHRDSRRVFALFLWRRWPVLHLTRRNIDDELGELGGIAGAHFHFKSKTTSPRLQHRNWRSQALTTNR
jgi:hypothetical protein